MSRALITVKIVHTVIWAVLASAVVFVFYSGLFNSITFYTWVAIAMVLVEAFVLLLFKWTCPLTVIARKYSDSPKDNFDIYLPNWLARHNKVIFTAIFLAGLVLVVVRVGFRF